LFCDIFRLQTPWPYGQLPHFLESGCKNGFGKRSEAVLRPSIVLAGELVRSFSWQLI